MLVSRGLHHAARLVAHASKGGGARGIHIPRRPPSSVVNTKNVLQTARNVLTRILYGPAASSGHVSGNNAIHAVRGIHLQNQLSLPARHMLARPAFQLPRPPVVRSGVHHVGLGTARNFSTARPIFQSLAQNVKNVPIVGRAASEIDVDLEKRRRKARLGKTTKGKENGSKKMKNLKVDSSIERYFPIQEQNAVEVLTTILTVPLYPSVSSVDATELSVGEYSPAQLLTPSALAAHQAHTLHQKRINSLFLRLEQADVWSRGAHYEAFSDAHLPGVCSVIRIHFHGWTAAQVGKVIGQGGRGWCTLAEVRTMAEREGPRSVDSTRPATPIPQVEMEEYVMPTLDFSSSFVDSHGFADHVPTPMTGYSTPAFDTISLPASRATSVFGDLDNGQSDDEWQWNAHTRPSSAQSVRTSESGSSAWMGLGFSAEFMSRSQSVEYESPF